METQTLLQNASCSVRNDELASCRYLLLTRFRFPWWFFHGTEHLLLSRKVEWYKEWMVCTRFWRTARVKEYWERNKGPWIDFLDYCDSHDINAIVAYSFARHISFGGICRRGLVSFEWPHPRHKAGSDWLHWDTEPPREAIVARFQELAGQLQES